MGAVRGKSGKSGYSLRVGKAEKHAKWPELVRDKKADVFEGYRQLVLDSGRRLRLFWRSKKGQAFFVTAKDLPVYQGRTLREATLKLVAQLPEYADCEVVF